ncbi:amidohydrolase family protein [Nisaea acidiphila]|uniref:Amidohydrolase family protein n=1 Tax=Nisaea acidiphila TaxID=1862145 RepID=A0A9J7ASC2_9PROT|nr:amidohydrolase family protein [Nisaea acidiphila]UUX48213.1 amidohydrolase family protein [Nisaea acidiphila]
MHPLLIEGGIVVTLDAERRVLEGASVLIRDGRIADIGTDLHAPEDAERIDASGMLVLPGLIDAHAHAGHALVKTLASDDSQGWFDACKQIYTRGSDADFWGADAALFALERIKAGVTTGVSMLGGGDSISRTDHPGHAAAHCEAISAAGTRAVVAVGCNRPPFPWIYKDWDTGTNREIGFERQLEVSRALADRWNGGADGRLSVALTYPVSHEKQALPDGVTPEQVTDDARQVRALSRELGLRFTQDGHREGSIAYAHREQGILGPDAYLSHCTNLTEADIAALRESGASVVHNPSAIASVRGRCPTPELIDLGVTVAIGSDAPAPDRSGDMFRHMQQAMHYHRRHFRDDQILPPGKALEMVTIDAAKAIGMETEIGSLETGKKADIVLLDLRKPHLVPANMPLHRAIYFANAADIDTTIVDGRILMRGRKVLSLDEDAVLDAADAAIAKALERTGLQHLLETRPGFWGQSRYS